MYVGAFACTRREILWEDTEESHNRDYLGTESWEDGGWAGNFP